MVLSVGNSSNILGALILFLLINGARTYAHQGFITTHGTHFLLDGSPFLFNGFNSYWMMQVASDPTQRYKVSSVMRESAAAGLTVCRTWAFADGSNTSLQISPGVYNQPFFEGLDFVISEARKFGVRLILSLVNNYNDYGGRQQYVQWARDAGVHVDGVDDFYSNPIVRGYYRDHINRVLTRLNTITNLLYKDDPTIMAWELINEPRCQTDYSGNVIHRWVQEMAAYTKSIDSQHLLEIGMEGFYGDFVSDRKQFNPSYQSVGTDFIRTNLLKEIDFATMHAYPDIWQELWTLNWLSGQSDYSQRTFLQRWMSSHWKDSRTILKKPLVFTEFGKSKKDPGFSTSSRDSFIDLIYRKMHNLIRNGGTIAGGLIWHVMAVGMEAFHDGYEIVLSRDHSTTTVITRQSQNMNLLSLWLRGNPRN